MALDFPQSPQLDEVFVAGDRAWKWNGYAWDKISAGLVSQPYIISGFFQGKLTAGELLLLHDPAVTVQFPANLAGSRVSSIGVASQTTDLLIKKNGTTVATARFTSGAQPTFLPSAAFTLAPGDKLTIEGAADATLSDVSVSLYGVR